MPHHNVIRGFKNHNAEEAATITQVVVTIRYTRFKVTTCLYLSPNNRARSLSTLNSARVATRTLHIRHKLLENLPRIGEDKYSNVYSPQKSYRQQREALK